MKFQKIQFLLLLLIGVLLVPACSKDDDDTPELTQEEIAQQAIYDAICGEADGTFNLSINGDSWGSHCGVGYRYGVVNDTTQIEAIVVYGYTNTGVYLNQGKIEMFYAALPLDGVRRYQVDEEEVGACYVSNIYTFSGSVEDPEDNAFCSDTDSGGDGYIELTNVSNEGASGSVNMTLVKEDGSETLTVSGNFNVKFQF